MFFQLEKTQMIMISDIEYIKRVDLWNCYTKFPSCRLKTATLRFRLVVQRIEILLAYCITDLYHLSFGVESHRQQSQQSCFRCQIVPRPPYHLK